jgi:hypothetical protein
LRSVRRAIATAPWRISERLLRSIQPYHPPEIACGNWASNPRMVPSGGLDNRCVLMPAHSGLRCLLMALSGQSSCARVCRYWTKADKVRFRPATVCPLLTQLRHWLCTAAIVSMPVSAPIKVLVCAVTMLPPEVRGGYAAARVHHASSRINFPF